jgi:hypothetical protein
MGGWISRDGNRRVGRWCRGVWGQVRSEVGDSARSRNELNPWAFYLARFYDLISKNDSIPNASHWIATPICYKPATQPRLSSSLNPKNTQTIFSNTTPPRSQTIQTTLFTPNAATSLLSAHSHPSEVIWSSSHLL